jgi:hypothetical protein
MTTLPTPQNEAYAISMFKTCLDMLLISGSGEHKSIHGLEKAMSWETAPPGVNGVSSGGRGGMIGAGGTFLVEEISGGWRRETSSR